ncbi:C-type lectin domain containing protein, partial [Trichostrongylus colubriformis]
NYTEGMNINVVCIFVVIMHIDVSAYEGYPCTPWIYNIEFRKCYRKFADIVSPKTAQKVCQRNGGNLVTICSEAENNFVSLIAHVATSYPYQDHERTWIGLRRNPNDRTQFQWLSGSSCNYTHWTTGEPNDKRGKEDWVHLYSEAEGTYNDWNDLNDGPYQFICERSTCPQEDVE